MTPVGKHLLPTQPPAGHERLGVLPPPLDGWGEVAVTRLTLALGEALYKAAGQLDMQSGLAAIPMEGEAMADAATFARARRRELSREFGRHMEQRYVRACHHRPSILEGYLLDMDASELRIIKHERLDDSLAPGLMAESIRHACWDSLQALAAEFSRLQGFSMAGNDIPLAPRIIEAALADTLREQDWDHDSKSWLMRALAEQLPRAVGELYRDLLHMAGAEAIPLFHSGEGNGFTVPDTSSKKREGQGQNPPTAPAAPVGNPAVATLAAGSDVVREAPQQAQPEAVAPPAAARPEGPDPLFARLARLKSRAEDTGRRFARMLDAIKLPAPPEAATPLSQPGKKPEAEARMPPPPVPATVPEASPASQTGIRIKDLKAGCWLELKEPGAPAKVLKLAWISPLRNLFLMTDHRGDRAMSLDADFLDGLLQAGWAKPIPAPGEAPREMPAPSPAHQRKRA